MGTLRAPAETDLTRFYAIFPQPALARDLFNIVEGHRVDAAIARAYPGIRRDMAKIQAASAERRPDLATLGDAQAVVEALLQHTLGLTPDLQDVAPATQALIADAVGLLERVTAEGANVGDAAIWTRRREAAVTAEAQRERREERGGATRASDARDVRRRQEPCDRLEA